MQDDNGDAQASAPWSAVQPISLSGLQTHAKRKQRQDKKRQRGSGNEGHSGEFTAAEDGEDHEAPSLKRRRVLGFEDGKMKVEENEHDRGATQKLVIPVPSRRSNGAHGSEQAHAPQVKSETGEGNSGAAGSASDGAAPQSVAAQAEAELLQDVKLEPGFLSKREESVTIPVQTEPEREPEEAAVNGTGTGYARENGGGKASLRAKLFANKRLLGDKDGSRASHRSAVPLLARQGGGDAASFQEDLARRPDDIPVDSDTFEKVPISEFGAAMLRGMGASEGDIHQAKEGPSSLRSQANRYRGTRSEHPGLGADKRNDVFAHLSQASDESAALRRPGRSSVFQEGMLVRLQTGAHVGAIAVVVQAEGVPGLNNMKVRLDKTRVITVRKDDAEIVQQGTMSEQEQAKMDEIVAAEEKERKQLRQAALEERKRRDAEAARKLEAQEQERRGGRSSSRQKHRSESSSSRKPAKGESLRSRRGWVHPGIRVRVVDHHWEGGRWYRCKGTVLVRDHNLSI